MSQHPRGHAVPCRGAELASDVNLNLKNPVTTTQPTTPSGPKPPINSRLTNPLQSSIARVSRVSLLSKRRRKTFIVEERTGRATGGVTRRIGCGGQRVGRRRSRSGLNRFDHPSSETQKRSPRRKGVGSIQKWRFDELFIQSRQCSGQERERERETQ